MWQNIINWLMANWQVVAALIAAIFGVPLAAGKNPLTLYGGMLGMNSAPPPDDDAADMAAFRRLEARFAKAKCKEGIDAMKVVSSHFMHSEGE